jgi:hypothetical protein
MAGHGNQDNDYLQGRLSTPAAPADAAAPMPSDEREKFTAWHTEKFGRALTEWVDDRGRFAWDLTEQLWQAWQARAALAAAPASPAMPSDERRDAVMRHDYPILQQFHTKHALGGKAAPSCLCCGHQTHPVTRPVAIKHMELPAIVICKQCRDSASPAMPSDLHDWRAIAQHYEAALRHLADSAHAKKDWQYAWSALVAPEAAAKRPAMPSDLHAAPAFHEDQTVNNDTYTSNLLESCANWLETRSHMARAGDEGELMRSYARDLRRIRDTRHAAASLVASSPAAAPQDERPTLADARRYRWLRDRAGPVPLNVSDGNNPLYGNPLDAAVDAARLSDAGQQK